MDARITKRRLADMLSYDWLKIIGASALAALFFCVFFMMIATRPADGQKFYVYAYNGLYGGADFNRLGDDLKNKNAFGYDVLDTGSEVFSSGGIYGNTVFQARRTSGEGRVMFVSDRRTEDEQGKMNSDLLGFLENAGTEKESFDGFLDPQAFLSETEEYLKSFFGNELTGELNEERARDAFMKRNGRDKRYRSAEKKEAGVRQEEARLEKLKNDYLEVKSAVDCKRLEYATYTGYNEKEHVMGFSVKSLNLTPLVYYVAEEEGMQIRKNSDIVLCLFDNGTREGDLKYETVNFLSYLLNTYGRAQ